MEFIVCQARNILYLALIAVSVSCADQNSEPIFQINGRIEGLSDGIAYLQSSEYQDSSLIENGKFAFSGLLQKPLLCEIEIEGIGKSQAFYVENSEIEIAGSIDSFEALKISGSKTEEERATYQSCMAVFDKEYADLEKEYESADEEREAQLDAIYEQIELRQIEAQKQFVREYPSSFLSIGILIEIDWSFSSASEYDEVVSLLDTTLSRYEGTVYLQDLVNRMRNVEIGEVAPDFEMNDMNGSPVRLSNMYPQSELLLLDFWASTCGPCRRENKNIRLAYDLYQNRGLDILGVSTDTRREIWLEAIEADGLVWKNVSSLKKWGENEVVSTYALRQVSQNFLLDQNGIIIAKDLRGESLFSKLDELLNSN